MPDTALVTERILNAPLEKVWNAITKKEEMDKWYFKIAAFSPEPGFEFRFVGQGSQGETFVHLCEVKEVIPLKKLSYSWRYEGLPGESLVTFELTPDGDQTKLRLTHSGLESFAGNGPDFQVESFTGGWQHIIGKSLTEYLESAH